jgi:hypothetical protein
MNVFMYFSIIILKTTTILVFCDDNPSYNIILNYINLDHNAHKIITVTIHRHKMKNPNPKKKSTGKNIFLQKSCAQKNEK